MNCLKYSCSRTEFNRMRDVYMAGFTWCCGLWLTERIHHAHCMAAKAKKRALKKPRTEKPLTTAKVNVSETSAWTDAVYVTCRTSLVYRWLHVHGLASVFWRSLANTSEVLFWLPTKSSGCKDSMPVCSQGIVLLVCWCLSQDLLDMTC